MLNVTVTVIPCKNSEVTVISTGNGIGSTKFACMHTDNLLHSILYCRRIHPPCFYVVTSV